MRRSEFNWTRAAGTVFAVHAALLFFPPLPPLHKGSLWSYLLAYTAVALLAWDAGSWGPRLIRWWSGLPSTRRVGWGVSWVGAVAAVGVAVHQVAPALFERYSREEGLWEPVSLAVFVSSAVVLFGLARGSSKEVARHLRLIGWGFTLLALEEVDYLGVFGALVGRIQGIYAGSLHDIIRLAEAGLVPGGLALIGGVAVLAVAVVLLRTGYLQPRRIYVIATSASGAWLAAAAIFLGLAAAEEASLFGVDFPQPTPEELVETLGAICLAIFTLEIGRTAPGPDATPPASPATGREEGRGYSDAARV